LSFVSRRYCWPPVQLAATCRTEVTRRCWTWLLDALPEPMPDAVVPDAVEPEPVELDPVEPEPVEPEAVEPVEPEPDAVEPVDPDPVEPDAEDPMELPEPIDSMLPRISTRELT